MRTKHLFTPASTAAILFFAGWPTRTSAASWDQGNHTTSEREAQAPSITNASLSFAIVDGTWPANDTIQAPVFNQPLDPALVDVRDVREWFVEIQGTSQGSEELQPRRDFPLNHQDTQTSRSAAGEIDAHASIPRSHALTGYRDAASSLALLAESSCLQIPMRRATSHNSTIIASEASVGPCFPEVPMTPKPPAPDAVMTAALNASIPSARSQRLAVTALFQPGSAPPKDGWNGTTTQTGGFPSSATCPTETLELPWAMSKTTTNRHSRTGYAQRVRTQARQHTAGKATPSFDGPAEHVLMFLDHLMKTYRITVTILLLMVHICAARLERSFSK